MALYAAAVVLPTLMFAQSAPQPEAPSTVKVPAPAIKSHTPDANPSHATRQRAFQVGTASWYGSDFQGEPTASGEPYDMYQLTAAHRTLPLGSWIKVTNLANKRWVVVRVNDRGPVPENRVLDLSYEAAKLLGFHGRGLTQVRIDVLDSGTTTSASLIRSGFQSR